MGAVSVRAETRLALVFEPDVPVHVEIADSFKDFFSDKPDYSFVEIEAGGGREDLEERISNSGCRYQFCIGNKAAEAGFDSRVPGVFTLVREPRRNGLVFSDGYPIANLTGVKWRVEPEQMFEILFKMAPLKTRAALFYSLSTLQIQKEFENKARLYGYEFSSIQVRRPRETLRRIKDLDRENVDFVFAIPDQNVFNARVLKGVLEYAGTHPVSLIGFSPSMTKRGALISFYVDFDILGKEAGERMLDIVGGRDVTELPLAPVNRFSFSINRKMAERANIEIPDEIASRATDVFE
jgi:putative ABC transport system substrate-binding protein